MKLDADIAMNFATVTISIAALLVSAFLAGRQLRVSQNATHTMIAVELLARERRTDEFMQSEEYILNTLANEHRPDAGVSTLPLEARRHVSRIALYYNALGQLAAYGVVDHWLLISTASNRIQQTWSILDPYIQAERLLRNSRYLSHFEHLACLAYEISPAEIEQRIRLRRFQSSEVRPPGSYPSSHSTEADPKRFLETDGPTRSP